MLQETGGAGVVLHLEVDRREQLARTEVVRIARHDRIEVGLGFFELATRVMRERTDHQQLLVACDPLRRQGVDQAGSLREVLARSGGIPPALRKQGQQVGCARLHRPALGNGQRGLGLVIAPEVDENAGARHDRVDQPGIEFDCPLVVLQGSGEVTLRMRNRATRVMGRSMLGALLHRKLGPLARQREIATSDQHRHLGGKRQRRLRVQAARLRETARGIAPLPKRRMCDTAQGEELEAGRGGEAISRKRVEQDLAPPLQQIDACQRHRHLGTVDAESQSLTERHLGRADIPLAEVGARKQEVCRQHVPILLQRVLELDDGAGHVLGFKALQPILVVATRGRRIGMRSERQQRGGEARDERECESARGLLHGFWAPRSDHMRTSRQQPAHQARHHDGMISGRDYMCGQRAGP